MTLDIRAVMLAVILVSPVVWLGVGGASPDGLLYEGISHLLFESGLYEDRVRNDQILPTAGHPFLIGLLRPIGEAGTFAVSLVAFGVLLALVAPHGALWFVPTMLSAFLFADALAHTFSGWGVESSIILTMSAVCFGLSWFILKPTSRSLAALSVALAVSLLVRPVLLPLLPFLAVAGMAYGYINGMRRGLAWGLSGPLLWFMTLALSFFAYGDGRLTGGTYSAIPLYAAFNEHIDLQRNYNSSLWRNVADSADIFDNRNGWLDRDERLKAAVMEFVLDNPKEAVAAVWFRIGRYTWDAESTGSLWVGGSAGYVLATWLSLSLAAALSVTLAVRRRVSRQSIASAALACLFIYLSVVNAAFVYSGVRYLTANFVVICFFVAMASNAIKQNVRRGAMAA